MNAPLRHPLPTPPARIAPLARLPLFFALSGKRVVVAGEGAAVAWKAELLAAAGARVDDPRDGPGRQPASAVLRWRSADSTMMRPPPNSPLPRANSASRST